MKSKSLRVCQVVPSINLETGGTSVSVPNLANSLPEHNVLSHLFTLDYPNRGQQADVCNVKLHSYPAHKLARRVRGLHPVAENGLEDLALYELDIIHNHGLWMMPNLYARKASCKANIPLIISPRGALEPWSLNRSKLIKKIAWSLYEFENLTSASLFHATSEQEANSIRMLGFRQPIAIIPNGVNVEHNSCNNSREKLVKNFPKLKDKKWLLFMSRIHPKKGLDNLLMVWKDLQYEFPDWHLVLAGPDSSDYLSEVLNFSKKLGISETVTFTGMLVEDYKDAALWNSELFVLPSYSENFGIAIAEALAYEVPAITTKGTPWQDLEQHECGWWIDVDKHSLFDSLHEAMSLPEERRKDMGRRGRKLVESKYSWASVGEKMSIVYRWVLHRDTKTIPKFVKVTS
ncbi:MAG: glycosyltransferase [Cyanobacteria bacterium P01_H01_bin.21]